LRVLGSPRHSWCFQATTAHAAANLRLPPAITSRWADRCLLSPTCRDKGPPSNHEPQSGCHHRAYPALGPLGSLEADGMGSPTVLLGEAGGNRKMAAPMTKAEVLDASALLSRLSRLLPLIDPGAQFLEFPGCTRWGVPRGIRTPVLGNRRHLTARSDPLGWVCWLRF